MPDDAPADTHFKQIVCGELHTAALTSAGAVYTWGLGKDGRLGHGDRESHWRPRRIDPDALDDVHVVQIACGGLHTAALTGARVRECVRACVSA